MPLTAMRAELNQHSFAFGEPFTLRLHFAAPGNELPSIANISLNAIRLERERDQSGFGFGATPLVHGLQATVSQTLGDQITPGLHVLCGVQVSLGSQASAPEWIPFEPIFFEVRSAGHPAADRAGIARLVAKMNEQRRTYAQTEIATSRVTSLGPGSGSAYRVLVFGIGCLLHGRQQLEGYCLVPLGRGLSYARMHSIVNQALSPYHFQVPFDPQIDRQHEQATPTFAIEYWRVMAADHEDALTYCRGHADLVFDLLGLDRGQKPREFFCIAFGEQQGDVWQRFSIPWYRGNLVSDFNQAATGNRIAVSTPRLERNPFLRLLVRSYAEATAEDDPGIAHLRAWTVLELLADRAVSPGSPISHVDGTPILNSRGNPVDTNAARAKVYELIRQSGTFGGHYSAPIGGVQRTFVIPSNVAAQPDAATRMVSLWDVVRAAYAIRNAVAHEGYFSTDSIDPADPDQLLAADLIVNTAIDPRRWVIDQAYSAIQAELNKP